MNKIKLLFNMFYIHALKKILVVHMLLIYQM